MDYYNLNQKEFADKINVSAQTISDILKDKRNAGDKITHGILEAFDEINPLWLIKGMGNILLDDAQMDELKKNKMKKDLHFKNLEELALFCANHEKELMELKVFSNIIEKNAAFQVLKIVRDIKGRD